MIKSLIINPGSTSTKLGIFEDEKLVSEETLRHSTEEIAKYIGADSLAYLPVECLGELVDHRFGHCAGCFTGDYPVDTSGAGYKNKFDEKIHK